jgi:hypothetical protein
MSNESLLAMARLEKLLTGGPMQCVAPKSRVAIATYRKSRWTAEENQDQPSRG